MAAASAVAAPPAGLAVAPRARAGAWARAGVVGVFGFACACPLLVLESVHLRLSDVACIAASALFALDVAYRRRVHVAVRGLAPLLLLTFGWIAVELYYGAYLDRDAAITMILVRWLMAFPAAYWLVVAAANPATRRAVLLGMTAGWLADTLLLVVDFAWFQAYGHPAFATDAKYIFWVGGEYRAIGLFDHPNGAAIASLYATPFLIGLAEEAGWRTTCITLGWVLTGVVFYVTRSRGATMASAGLLAYWTCTRSPRVGLAALLLLAIALATAAGLWPDRLAAATSGGPFGQLLSRFTNAASMEENSAGRVETAVGAVELMLTHPLGMGSSYGPRLLAMTGFEATHNALLQLALLGGLPLTLTVIWRLLARSARMFGRAAVMEDWTALYFLLVSMFEAHFFSPMTSIVLLWLCVRSVAPRLRAMSAHGRIDLAVRT